MVIQAENLGDLIAMTLKELGEAKFTEIATDIQEHVAARNLVNKNRVQFSSGTAVQWNLMVTNSGAATFTGMFASDNVNIGDVMKTASVPWRHLTTNYAVEARELDMNSEPRRIVDLLKIRRLDSMISLVEKIEQRFWALPASTDDVNPFGLPYYLVKNNTTGFNGGAPSGYTAGAAGLSSTTYPRWSNFTGQYTAISKDDLIRLLRQAATKTKWMPPVDGIPTYSTGDQNGFYTSYAVVAGVEELLEAQNDRLGEDVASMDGKALLRRTPLTWVPALDADTTNPIYGVNWGVFKTYILRPWWNKMTKIENVPGQHLVSAVYMDSTFNWICKDRRKNFVIATNTGLPA